MLKGLIRVIKSLSNRNDTVMYNIEEGRLVSSKTVPDNVDTDQWKEFNQYPLQSIVIQ
jgi:hypothetical protein